MSNLTAREVELQLSVFDMQVRGAVNDGTIVEYMERHRKDIKAFYKICRATQGEPRAAFNARRYLHEFLHDWRFNKDGEEYFLRRQQGKIREFDGEPLPPFTMPATPRRWPIQAAQAIPGGGPQTAAARAAKERGVHFAARLATPAVPPLFSALNRDTDSDMDMAEEGRDIGTDVEMIGKGKGKMKEEKKVPAKVKKMKVPQVEERMPQAEEVSQEEEEEVIAPPRSSIVSRPPAPKVKPRPLPVKKVDVRMPQAEEVSEEEVIAPMQSAIVSRPPAPKAKPRPVPVPTGELHDPPCEQCEKLNRLCEKEKSGRACVSCKRNKHKCGYSMPNVGRQVKSTAMVEESEWEDAAESGAATGAAATSRAARPAAKRAKQAIQLEAATASKPPRRSRKKSTPPALNAAAALNAVADAEFDERMTDMETLLRQAHNKVDGAINALQKASRLERCEQKLDRLMLLLEAVCERVGLTVAKFGQEAAENEVAGPAAEQEMAAPAAEHEVAVPAADPDMAAPAAEKEPAAPAALPEQAASQPVPPPTLSLIPPTPHQSQDTDMRPAAEEDVDMPAAPGLLDAPNTPDPAAQPIPAASEELAASKTLDVAAYQPTDEPAAPGPPADVDVLPVPKPRSRKKTPVPTGTLQLPPPATRSRSRSRSPSALPEASGSKRKAEEAGAEGESAPKKARA